MLKSQLDESNQIYENLKKEILKKHRKGINSLNTIHIDNMKNQDQFFTGFNFIKSKIRPGTESQDKIKNLTIIQPNETNRVKIKNSLITKKKEFSFPKIKNVKDNNTDEKNFFKNKFSIYNNVSSKWANKIKSINRDNNKFLKINTISQKEENKGDNASFFKNCANIINEEDKEKKRDNSHKFETITTKNIKLTNISKRRNISLQKIKNSTIQRESMSNNNTPKALMIHAGNRITKESNHLFNNKIFINNKKKANKPLTSPVFNELKEINSDRMNKINNNKFNDIKIPSTIDGIIPIQKKRKLNLEIFKNKFKNFKKSIISNKEDINKEDYIKGYGYNSNVGNFRENNEDAIAITKIYFNNDKNNYCHYFGIFDGHGGKGCSNYLKDNLHKNIKEFSSIGIKIGIDLTEERFKLYEAVDEKGEIKDSSGSCGIILLIKGKKCIIANIGDSRLVIFKNKKVEFTTMDHKPDSIIERARIEIAGGTLYKAPPLFSLHQNEKNAEMSWRVLPGKLSVSRTFGDILAKEEKYGGNKTVIIALPDITEIELDDNYNFIVIGSDGIFDVLQNEELLDCINVVIKEKKKIKDKINDEDIPQLCGDFASMIIKSALTKGSFDNLSCIVIALNLNDLLPIN